MCPSSLCLPRLAPSLSAKKLYRNGVLRRSSKLFPPSISACSIYSIYMYSTSSLDPLPPLIHLDRFSILAYTSTDLPVAEGKLLLDATMESFISSIEASSSIMTSLLTLASFYFSISSSFTRLSFLQIQLFNNETKRLQGENPSESEVHELVESAEKYSLTNHLFQGLWGLISAYVNEIEFNYKEYARQRFKQYWLKKPIILGTSEAPLVTEDESGF